MGRVAFDKSRCRHLHHLHYGSGMPVFRGELRQDGYGIGGLLSGLFRRALPVLAPVLKSGAKALANTALKTGRRVLSDVVSDRRGFKESLQKHVGDALDPSSPDLPPKRQKVRVHSKRKRRDIFN